MSSFYSCPDTIRCGIALGILASVFCYAVYHFFLLPRPIPGIPYNKKAANNILGDWAELQVALNTNGNGLSAAMFGITTARHGLPISQFLMPGCLRPPIVMVDDAREVEDIMVRRSKEFDRIKIATMAFSTVAPHCTAGNMISPKLKAQKRLWSDTMSPEFLRTVVAPNILAAAEDLADLWTIKATKEVPFQVMQDFNHAALDAIYVAILGDSPGITRREIAKLVGQPDPDPVGATIVQGWLDAFGYLGGLVAEITQSAAPRFRTLWCKAKPAYWRHQQTVASEQIRIMTAATERFSRLGTEQLDGINHDTCAMDMVLRRKVLQARKDGLPVQDFTQDREIMDELILFIAAGHDSTAKTLSFCVQFLEKYPSVQETLRSALLAAFPKSTTPSAQSILDTNIPYLDAFIEELARVSCTTAITWRTAVVDTEILGVRIPKNTTISLNTRLDRTRQYPVAEHLRSASCQAKKDQHPGLPPTPEPSSSNCSAKETFPNTPRIEFPLEDFEPRRWLVRDEESGRGDVFDAQALPSLIFGGGMRGCFGKKLAMIELRIILVVMVLRFEFMRVPDGLKSDDVGEGLFRHPRMAYASLKKL